tara:strand:+ start:195 stop:1349 length:1155 start_codon:yes stop_codon:yes gene_type:complete
MEILAPAGNQAMLQAAINAGADSLYFGLKEFNMRASANNFTIEEVKAFPKIKKYLTINTIIYDEEINRVKEVLTELKDHIDAVICWDLAVIKIAKELQIPIHLSTQASVANLEAIKQYEELGVERVILARELSIKQIKEIKQNTNLEIEVFCHGAMCVSYSGRCFLSQHLFQRSANRGKCIQPCRREYKITDTEEGKELTLGKSYIMSPKDLCTLPFLDELQFVDCLKIEGRAKTPEYVDTVVRAYKSALELIKENNFTQENKDKLIKELEKVYNRDFHSGFYIAKPFNEFTDTEGNKSKTKKTEIGKVINFYKEHNVAAIQLYKSLKLNDKIMFLGNKTGVVKQEVKELQINHKKVEQASECLVGIKTEKTVRENDKVYLIEN